MIQLEIIGILTEEMKRVVTGIVLCYAAAVTRGRAVRADNRSAGRFAGNLFRRVRLGTSNLNSFCQLL